MKQSLVENPRKNYLGQGPSEQYLHFYIGCLQLLCSLITGVLCELLLIAILLLALS